MNEETIDRTLQRQLRTLIADEYFAGQLYMLWSLSVKREEKHAIDELFAEIAKNEIYGHMRDLVEWCAQNGIDTPCTPAELKRAASKYSEKAMNQMRRQQPAEYYIAAAQKLEQQAAMTYKSVIENEHVAQYTDLQSALWNAYYDRQQHLEKLESAATMMEAARVVNFGY